MYIYIYIFFFIYHFPFQQQHSHTSNISKYQKYWRVFSLQKKSHLAAGRSSDILLCHFIHFLIIQVTYFNFYFIFLQLKRKILIYSRHFGWEITSNVQWLTMNNRTILCLLIYCWLFFCFFVYETFCCLKPVFLVLLSFLLVCKISIKYLSI